MILKEKKKKMFVKRLVAFMLAFTLIFSNFSNFPTGSSEENSRMVAEAAGGTTGTATGSDSDSGVSWSIPSLDYSGGKTVWRNYADGKQIFCSTCHGMFHTGDKLSYKTYNAVTCSSKLQPYAKALTYWNKEIKPHDAFNTGLMQAYFWATGTGKSKTTAVYEAGHSMRSSFTKSDATKFCDAISKTSPEGTLYKYEVTSCSYGHALSKHQTLYSLSSETEKPKTGTVSYSDSASSSKTVELTVNKISQNTKKGLPGAVFNIYLNNKILTASDLKVTAGTASGKKFTTNSNGKIIAELTHKYSVSTIKSTKTYVKNWNSLTKKQQQEATKNGYYSSYRAAYAAAKKEVTQKLDSKLKALEKKSYSWKVVEVEAPEGFYVVDSSQIKTEKGNTFSLTYTFKDEPIPGDITVKKINASTGKTDPLLKGAEYSVTAAETIYKDNDGKTVAYKAGAKVGTITIGSNGTGKLKNLWLGKYTVVETKAPEGFELDPTKYTVTLTDNAVHSHVNSKDKPIPLDISLKKLYADTGKPEKNATFALYSASDVKNALQVKVTDANGELTFSGLKKGDYIVKQLSGDQLYKLVAPKNVTLKSKSVSFTLSDAKITNAEIQIFKTESTNNDDTGIHKVVPEKDAEFKIYDAQNKLVATVVTDENGEASYEVKNAGKYIIKQTKGSVGHALAAPQTVTITDSDIKNSAVFTYEMDNPFTGYELEIYKDKQAASGTVPEENAEFVIVDNKKAKTLTGKTYGSYPFNIESDANRIALYNDLLSAGALVLDESGVPVVMRTDVDGYAACLLDESQYNEVTGVSLLQISGESGYEKQPLITKSTSTRKSEDKLVQVFTYKRVDPFENYGYIEINKVKKVSAVKTAAEANITFQIIDNNTASVVQKIVTDKNGYAISGKLPEGEYTVHQVNTTKGTQVCDDFTVTIDAAHKKQTFTYNLTNEEVPVELRIKKVDKDNKEILLSGAVFTVYNEAGNAVAATITTDENGTGSAYLPYGTYQVKETTAPEGYKLSEETKTITIDASGVKYESLTLENGNTEEIPVFSITMEDEYVYGHISVNKFGQILSGVSEKTAQGLTIDYENGPLSGAEFALYAKEDIKDPKGTVIHKAGSLVAKGVTGSDGTVTFERTANGQKTPDLYLGTYYVKEISAPDGYLLDTTEHEVVLTRDKKQEDMNEIREDTTVSDVSDAADRELPPNTEDGIIEKWDISQNGDGSVMATLYEDGLFTITGDGTAKVFPHGEVDTISTVLDDFDFFNIPWYDELDGSGAGENAYSISLNNYIKRVVISPTVTIKNMDYWFLHAQALESVSMDAASNGVESMEGTFGYCYKLESLDLSDCKTLKNFKYGCYYCPLLKKADLSGAVNIDDFSDAFRRCYLIESVIIDANPTEYKNIFRETAYGANAVKGVYLSGKSSLLKEMAALSNNGYDTNVVLTKPGTVGKTCLATKEVGYPVNSNVVVKLYSDGSIEMTGSGDVDSDAFKEFVRSNVSGTISTPADRQTKYFYRGTKSFTMSATVTPTNMDNWFDNFTCLETVNIPAQCFSKVTSMNATFQRCRVLENPPDLSQAVNVEDMSYTFQWARSIETVPDLSNCKKITNMNGCFNQTMEVNGTLVLNSSSISDTEYMLKCTACWDNVLYLDGTAASGIYQDYFNAASNAYFVKNGLSTVRLLSDTSVDDITVTLSPTVKSVVPGSTLTYDLFNYEAVLGNGTKEVLFPDAGDISISPAEVPVDSTQKSMTVTISFKNNYAGISSKTVTVPINTASVTASDAADADEVNYKLDLFDELQTVNIKINKVDESGIKIAGAVFQLKANVDILDAKGNVAVKAGTVLATVESDETKDLSFGVGLPTNAYSSNKNMDMYVVKEIQAPSGYLPYSNPLFFSGKAGNSTTPTIEYTKTAVNYPGRNPKMKVKKVSGNAALTNSSSSYSLSGAVYGIYTSTNFTDANKVTQLTTDSSGETGYATLPAGTYYVKELIPSPGYDLCQDPGGYHKITLTSKNETTPAVVTCTEPAHSLLTLSKVSANANLTNGNSCYSLKGAVYNVYKEQTCKTLVGTFTTKKDGSTNEITLPAGDYWVKEITASPGYGLCDGKQNDGADAKGVHKVTVERNKVNTFTCKEPPLDDPFALKLQKKEAETGSTTGVGAASLEDALFQVDYWDNTSGTTSGTPVRSWVFRTNEKGTFNIANDKYLVKEMSDELYKNLINEVIYPLGTYHIKEIQPPKYYQLEGTMKFKNSSTEFDVKTGVTLILAEKDGKPQFTEGDRTIAAENLAIDIFEKVYKGSVKVKKYDTDGTTPLEGVTFKLAGDDGKEYTGTTDSNGEYVFTELIPQHYVLTEIKTVDGHNLLKDNVDVMIPLEMTEEEINSQGADKSQAVWDEAAGAYCFYDLTFEISNDVHMIMPSTGGTQEWLYAMMIAAFILIGGCTVVAVRKKRR